MSFTIRLSQDLTAIEAGATVPLSIEVTNKNPENDRYEIQIEGVDPEWVAYPEPVFSVSPNETHSQKVFFKPPRASESLSGNYPFVARVRSLESGEAKTAQGVLQIKPFNHLSIELSPKKGYTSPMRQANVFTLTVMNLGNTEHTLQLSGSDPDEECTYDFANDQVTVGPGQQKQVEATVNAANSSWIAPVRLFGFSIAGRSIQSPNLVSTAHGQLERRPLLTVGSFLTVSALIALFLLWFAFRPQPATISLRSESTTALFDQTIDLHWRATNADAVRLEIRRNVEGKSPQTEVLEDRPLQGSESLKVRNEDTITVTASAVIGDRTVTSRPVTISVSPPPVEVPPKITKFTASTQDVRPGDPVVFSFEYSPDTVKLVLSPMTDKQLTPPIKQIEVRPTNLGPNEYYLIAYNKNGAATTSKPITVRVTRVSDANILSFAVTPKIVQEPETRAVVSWRVTNAEIVQLHNLTTNELNEVDAQGSIELTITKDTKIKLIATDVNNITRSQTIEIKYKPLPPPVDPNATTGGTAGTTGGPPPTTTTTGGATTGGDQ